MRSFACSGQQARDWCRCGIWTNKQTIAKNTYGQLIQLANVSAHVGQQRVLELSRCNFLAHRVT